MCLDCVLHYFAKLHKSGDAVSDGRNSYYDQGQGGYGHPQQQHSPQGGYQQGGYQQQHGYQQQGGYPPPPPQQRKRGRKKIFLIGGGVFFLLIIVVAAAGGGGGGTSGTAGSVTAGAPPAAGAPAAGGGAPAPAQAQAQAGPEHADDVAITDCSADAAGWAGAKVTVTNHSSKSSNYVITITFESADGSTQIGTGLIAVNGLRPGQQSPQETSALKDAIPGYKCRVSDITRYAA